MFDEIRTMQRGPARIDDTRLTRLLRRRRKVYRTHSSGARRGVRAIAMVYSRLASENNLAVLVGQFSARSGLVHARRTGLCMLEVVPKSLSAALEHTEIAVSTTALHTRLFAFFT
jgi:hypothetical protein